MSTGRKDAKRPPGRPPKHYARWLARRLNENGLDGRTGPAKLLKMRADELADDAGGWTHLTNREAVLVRRTAALLLLCETIEHYVFSRESPFTDTGELLAVLSKNYIGYSNAARLNLVALGLRPDRADKTPSLAEYLAARTAASNGASAAPAVGSGAPIAAGPGSGIEATAGEAPEGDAA